MDNKKNKFDELYKEYQRLRTATHIEAQIIKRGQPYKVNYIKPEDLMRRKALAEELLRDYKENFKGKPVELFEVMEDTR